MSLELGTDERYPEVVAALQRAAAVRVADHIAAQHPTELDDVKPKLAGRLLAKDPDTAGGLLELLDYLGLKDGPHA